MKLLQSKNIRYLIVHTAAADFPCTVKDIYDWHIAKKYLNIGYHYIITGSPFDKDPIDFYLGRDIRYQGAHALGSNQISLGVCLTGHGDFYPFTMEQIEYLFALFFVLKQNFKNLEMIGHYEVNHYDLTNKIYTMKTCPGIKNNMEFIRYAYKYLVEKQFNIPENIEKKICKLESLISWK